MTLRETLLKELETADDTILTEAIDWLRSRKTTGPTPPANAAPIHRGGKLEDLLEFAGTWAGNDLEDCLETVYATRSESSFSADRAPFQ